ncbi:MAG: hypothetical protein R2827_14800 [Bdellovibrionales bacterium]
MIGDFLFFLKTLIMTFIVILVLQIKVGELTLEQKAAHWARQSSLVEPIQEVAHGGLLIVRDGWRKLYGLLSGEAQEIFKSEEAPGNRSLGITLERSKEYFKEKASKAKAAAKEQSEIMEEVAREKAEEARRIAKEKAHQMADELSENLSDSDLDE